MTLRLRDHRSIRVGPGADAVWPRPRGARLLPRALSALVAGGVLVAWPGGVEGQRLPAGGPPSQAPDTVRMTALERARARLLGLGAVGRDAPLDSLGPDSLRVDSLQLPDIRVDIEGMGERGEVGEGLLARDSIVRALLRLGGYVATEYSAREASYDAASGRLDLRLEPEVLRLGNRLSADSTITYLEAEGVMCASGRPTGSGPGLTPIVADSLCYLVEGGRVVAYNAETELNEGATWRTRLPRGYLVGDSVYGENAIFTDCNLPWHEGVHYHFSAKKFKVVAGEWLVARDVTLNFQDVPVFWLPFMVQGLSDERRSGILMPRFGINDIARQSTRYNRKIEDVGFYWAVSDHFGLEMSMDVVSNDHTALNGFFDYKFNRQFLSGALALSRYWKAEGGRDLTLRTNHSWRPDERTNLNVDGTYTSSVDFIRNRSYDPRELSRSIASNAGVRRRFDWGNGSLSASRQQYLADGRVVMTLPDLSVSVSSMELFPQAQGLLGDATWNGSLKAGARTRTTGDAPTSLTQQDQRDVTGNLSSGLSLGSLSWRQQVSFEDQVSQPRAFAVDSLEDLPRRYERGLDWNTSISYSQRLVGTSTLTPSLTLRGGTLQGDTTGGQTVAAPTTLNFGAGLRTDFFGFWPGAGPFERFRHKVTPTVSYTYAPQPTVTERQRQVFGTRETRERNTISIGLNQTFEAKYHPEEGDSADAESADSLAEGAGAAAEGAGAAAGTAPGASAAALEAAGAAAGEPRKLPASRTINLLSINTDAVVYDFVAAREGEHAITTADLSNTLSSDLLRGLQLRVTHDLFAEEEGGGDGRSFAPHLSRVSTGFRLDGNSWIFRTLGLSGGGDEALESGSEPADMPGEAAAAPPTDYGQQEFGLIGTRRRTPATATGGQVGAWDASLDFSLNRPREGTSDQESALLRAQMNFQPTELWSVNWSTSYDFTEGVFADHFLTFTRQMHDWDANFDFVKAQNGNFSFQFRVQLRANPDIKVDYEQRSDLELSRPGSRR